MREQELKFNLPKNMEKYLATLSKIYGQEGQRQLQEIIVNSQIRVHEQWSRDNWNGGTYGHALYLTLPEPLFLTCLGQKEEFQNKLKEDLNRISNVQNEFIEEVFFEFDVQDDPESRKNSGVLLFGKRVIPADATKRIWGETGFRLFISHKAEVKKEVAALKKELALFGVSCFVAHMDIAPTKAWQDEIENALASMDAFVAVMTKNFHESDWTDQEVGFAFARGVPIIAVRLGRDPYGFIGRFQALTSSWATCGLDLAKILIKHDRMFAAYVQALREIPNWESGNKLGELLPAIERLSQTQIDEIASAYNETQELRGCYAFNGKNPYLYGDGLLPHLNRLGDREFIFDASGQVKVDIGVDDDLPF